MAEAEGQNRVAINTMWLLVSVAFSSCLCRPVSRWWKPASRAQKAPRHTMMMNFCIYFIALLGFWAVGYALMYGAAGAERDQYWRHSAFWRQPRVFAIPGLSVRFSPPTVFFLSWQQLRCWRLRDVLISSRVYGHSRDNPNGRDGRALEVRRLHRSIGFFIVSMILYPIFGHWAWGGGWLSVNWAISSDLGCGYVDFAGSRCRAFGWRLVRHGGRDGFGAAHRQIQPRWNCQRDSRPQHSVWLCWAFSSWRSVGSASIRVRLLARRAAATCASASSLSTTMMASAGGAFATLMYIYLQIGKASILR